MTHSSPNLFQSLKGEEDSPNGSPLTTSQGLQTSSTHYLPSHRTVSTNVTQDSIIPVTGISGTEEDRKIDGYTIVTSMEVLSLTMLSLLSLVYLKKDAKVSAIPSSLQNRMSQIMVRIVLSQLKVIFGFSFTCGMPLA